MNNLLNACLVALTAIAATEPSTAQPPVLRAGVSVEMVVTRNAAPMPDADAEDSLILAVTAKGTVYFGITPVSPAGLPEKIRAALSGRAQKKLYLKGDARTSYANVAAVLDAVRKAGVDAPNLLTAQQDSPEPAYPVPPKGLEVLVGPSLPPAPESIVVEARNAEQALALSIDNERTTFESLPAALKKLVQDKNRKTVVLKADGRLPFRDVVRVIDACRSMRARVYLNTESQ